MLNMLSISQQLYFYFLLITIFTFTELIPLCYLGATDNPSTPSDNCRGICKLGPGI